MMKNPGTWFFILTLFLMTGWAFKESGLTPYIAMGLGGCMVVVGVINLFMRHVLFFLGGLACIGLGLFLFSLSNELMKAGW